MEIRRGIYIDSGFSPGGGGVPPSAPLVTIPQSPPPVVPPKPSWLDRVPVFALGVFNATASHVGSAAAMVTQIGVFPHLAPIAPIFFRPEAALMPSFGQLAERYVTALEFNLAVVTPLFTGLECLCSQDKTTRARWRQRLHVDSWIIPAGTWIWRRLTNNLVSRWMDTALSTELTFPHNFTVPDEVAPLRLRVNYWQSFKDDVATVALYTKEFVMRGIAGVTSLLTRRMDEKIGWATKVKEALTVRPLRRWLQVRAHRRAIRRAMTPDAVEQFQQGTPELQGRMVETIAERSSAAQNAVDQWMSTRRIGRLARRIDDLSHFVGRVFPGTRGRVAGAVADLAGNVTTDVISADILGGGKTSLVASVGPSMIVSVAGAFTNAGLAENMLRVNDPEPAGRWAFAQLYARRVVLAVGRSTVYRSFAASEAATGWLTYGAQVAVSLWSLGMADRWVRSARAAAGLPMPDEANAAGPNVIDFRSAIARDLRRSTLSGRR